MRARVVLVASLAALLVVLLAGQAVGSLSSPPAAAQEAPINWPQFRFDRLHTGFQPFETTLNASNVPRLQLAWQAQLGALVTYSSPAVVNGVAYIGSSDGRLWAYRASGCGQQICTSPLWTSTNLGQVIDSPTVANGLVYVGSQTSPFSAAGKLDVFRADGCGKAVCRPIWRGVAGTQSILQSSPTVVGGRVYVGADDGKLYVFQADGCGAATCQPRWTGSIGEPVFDSTPAVSNGVVYVGSVHHLSAFPAAGCGASTCQPLWQGSHQDDFVYGSPAVFGGRVYIGVESEVGVFNASGCGQQQCGPLWLDFGTGTQAAILSSPTVANGVVYAGKMNGEVLAWKAGPCGQFVCDEIWRFLTNDPVVSSSPTVVNGTVYIGGANKLAFPEDTTGRLYVFTL